MHIRKRSFFEVFLPIVVTTFLGMGTSFIDALHGATLRWIFIIILFFYLFLNKKLLIHTNYWWKALLFIYLLWCISTTLWSEVPILSFFKSTMFALDIITMFSAGALWVVRFGFARCFNWMFLVLVLLVLFSGFFGDFSVLSEDNFGSFSAYSGLSGNPNGFAFLVSIVAPLVFLKLYQQKKNTWPFLGWLIILIIDIRFLLLSYCRSALVTFICILSFFVLSLSLSKKILGAILSFFCITLILVMMPVSYLESFVAQHVVKLGNTVIDAQASPILQDRVLVWQKSYQQAMKGGIMGGGFAVTIGDKNFSIKNLSGVGYGREKGNSQFAIMEETGIVGLVLYALILISFFSYVIPYYRRLTGHDKVAMGLALGTIVGLQMESIVEGWWDSAAGPEVICFWTLAGVVYGMIYLKRNLP